ncbi:uncharacterized protein LOC131958387 [Physella acuta]|uniref:uncharacterized protein LOC131958387 n=1 Tax=Physella acuta TaxID=109671 RepID=UPI0027DB3129|nr:uncharacterized protein LOC131958387 [Physella acuta]
MTKKVKVMLQMLVMCMHHLTVFCAEILNSQENITLVPMRLLQRNANNTNYMYTLNSRAEIKIYISGYPAPSQYKISKESGGVTNEFIVSSAKSSLMLESFLIVHTFVLVPEGIITFVVKTITPDSFGNYFLSIHNGVGNNLIYSFKFTEELSSKGAAVAGGVTAAAVVMVVATVIVMYFKRKSL